MIEEVEKLYEKLHSLKLNLARSIGISKGMKVLDVGCGQGTFAVCVAELVAGSGSVTAVDISDEDLGKMNENLERHNVRPRVTFVRVDAAELPRVFAQESFDMAVSYRLIEELKQPMQLPKIVSSIAEVLRRGGKVVMLELSTETSSTAEENLIRLHRDIGKDYFPAQRKILRCLRDAGLNKVGVETVSTNISYSAKAFLKSSISQDEVFSEFKERIMKELWPSIEQYGMKYPSIRKYSGQKP